MNEKEYATLKEKFLKMTPSVPLSLRSEIIALVDKKPIDWNVADEEVKRDGKNAKKILEQLKKTGLI